MNCSGVHCGGVFLEEREVRAMEHKLLSLAALLEEKRLCQKASLETLRVRIQKLEEMGHDVRLLRTWLEKIHTLMMTPTCDFQSHVEEGNSSLGFTDDIQLVDSDLRALSEKVEKEEQRDRCLSVEELQLILLRDVVVRVTPRRASLEDTRVQVIGEMSVDHIERNLQRTQMEKAAFLARVRFLGLRLPKTVFGPHEMMTQRDLLRLTAQANLFRSIPDSPLFCEAESKLCEMYEREREKAKGVWDSFSLEEDSLVILDDPARPKTYICSVSGNIHVNMCFRFALLSVQKPSLSLDPKLTCRSRHRIFMNWNQQATSDTPRAFHERMKRLTSQGVPHLPKTHVVRFVPDSVDSKEKRAEGVLLSSNSVMVLSLHLSDFSLLQRLSLGLQIAQTFSRLHELGFAIQNVKWDNLFVQRNKDRTLSILFTRIFKLFPLNTPCSIEEGFVSPEQIASLIEGRAFRMTLQSEVFVLAILLDRMKNFQDLRSVHPKCFYSALEQPQVMDVSAITTPKSLIEGYHKVRDDCVSMEKKTNSSLLDPLERWLCKALSFNPSERPPFDEVFPILEASIQKERT